MNVDYEFLLMNDLNFILIFFFCLVGLNSPSGSASKSADDENLQRSQTIGQRIMGNLFLRNLSSKPKSSDASVPSSPVKV